MSPHDPARGAMTVEALEVTHGPVRAVRGVSLTVQPGEMVTLLGPSGCGKTTTLRALAGLERPVGGRIAVNGRVVFDRAAGIDLPPEQRRLAMVFQSYAIWPHMSVFENVAFGLRARRVRGKALGVAVRRALEAVDLAALIDRPATHLSGGQQQRVALARAIAGDPGLVLFDEPLSNLDAQLRLAMRAEIKTLQARLGLTAVYVTHDQEEAMALSDRVAVMRDGMIEQLGTPVDLHQRPANAFVATFLGMRNVLPCTVERAEGQIFARLTETIRLAVRGAAPPGPACLCFRPLAVELSPAPVPGAFAAELETATYLGDFTQFALRSGAVAITASGLPRPGLIPGATVFWSVRPDACFLVPA